MATSASSVLYRVVTILQDTTSVRWSMRELVSWLNDGQRAVQVKRPDATATTVTVTLAAGTRQNLDDMSLIPVPAKLIEVSRNMAPTSTLAPVRLVSRSLLDVHTPGWYSATASVSPRHYTFDPREPRVFHVDPPAPAAPAAPAQVELTHSAFPVDVAEPAVDATFADVTGDIFLSDTYASALVDYVLYRAYSKDAEYAGNGERAAAHYGTFAGVLGDDAQATTAVQPTAK